MRTNASQMKTNASHVSGPAVSGSPQANNRTGSVDSQMTSLSGASDLTNASQTISNDGIGDVAHRVRSQSLTDKITVGLNTIAAGGTKRGAAAAAAAAGRRDLGGAGGSGSQHESLHGTGQVPVCTLCDAASSDFSCRACGGLTFCEKCALSLHTNKFLGGHSLENILDPNDTVLGSDLAIRRATMDAERAAREIYSDEARQARRAAEDSHLQDELRLAAAAGRDRARDEMERRNQAEKEALARGPQLDMRALAADRSVLAARAKELRSCIDILRRLGVRLAEEQASCVDATRSAGDAIRKKFDLLRSLINQKESAFLAVVQDAGKARHDAGGQQRTAVAAAVAETTAFADNLELQLQRMEGNHAMFNDCRAGLMDDTRAKIAAVDAHIHKFEGVVQEVRAIPLGVVVPVDGIVTALQMLQPPERTIGSAEVAMLNAADALLPVPATSFESQLGVQHFRSTVAGDNSRIDNNNAMPMTMMTKQQQQQQQQQQGSQRWTSISSQQSANNSINNMNNDGLRRGNIRSNSPSGSLLSNSAMIQQVGGTTTVRSSSNFAIREIQRTSSPMRVGQQQSLAYSSVPRGSNAAGASAIPPEVRELRRALNASRGGTPTSRLTPTRRVDSPMRSGSGYPLQQQQQQQPQHHMYSIPTSSPAQRTSSPISRGPMAMQPSGRVGGVTPGGNNLGLSGQPVSWPMSARASVANTPPRGAEVWRM